MNPGWLGHPKAEVPRRVVEVWMLGRLLLQLGGTVTCALAAQLLAPSFSNAFDMGAWTGLIGGQLAVLVLSRYRFGAARSARIKWSYGTPVWLLPAIALAGALVTAYLTWPWPDSRTGVIPPGHGTGAIVIGGQAAGTVAFAAIVAYRRWRNKPMPAGSGNLRT